MEVIEMPKEQKIKNLEHRKKVLLQDQKAYQLKLQDILNKLEMIDDWIDKLKNKEEDPHDT